MVHLYSEDLPSAWIRRCVREQENHLLTWLHHPLLHTARQDIADALDFVDPGDWHTHRGTRRPLWHTAELVEHIVNCVTMDRLLAAFDVLPFPPTHVLGLFQQVVTHPTGDGQHRRVLLDEILLPTHLHEHALHLVRDLVVARLLIGRRIAIHLVHTD